MITNRGIVKKAYVNLFVGRHFLLKTSVIVYETYCILLRKERGRVGLRPQYNYVYKYYCNCFILLLFQILE